MNFFEKILNAIDSVTIKTPTNYSLFHIFAILICIALTIFICLFFKDASEKTMRKILFVSWVVIVVLEIIKQLIFSFSLSNGNPKWSYQWYAFPFQLCSAPLYIIPFVIFTKNSKIKDYAMSFLGFFSLFGGLCVYVFPNDVFTEQLFIDCQTMIHHGIQIIVGIYMIVYNRKKLNLKYFLGGLIVFVIMFFVAILLNLLVHSFTSETFNMFYVSPYFDCTLPVLSMIYPKVPYIIFFFIYLLGFALIGLLIFAISKLSILLSQKKNVKE